MADVATRQRKSSSQRARHTLASLLSTLPTDVLASEEAAMLSSIADCKVYKLVHLIYRARPYEAH